MTHEDQSTALTEVLQLLSDHGFDGMAEAIELLLNEAMKLERAEVLGAMPYQRTEARRGYANGFKPKTVQSRLGRLSFRLARLKFCNEGGSSSDYDLCSKHTGIGTRMAITSDLVTAHADAVWRTAFRLLNNREDALDCYQQTFLDAMHLGDGSIRNWQSTLCCIATRRAMDRLRERYRELELRRHGDVLQQFEPAPDQQALNDELRRQVRQKLSTLPAQQAEAFWLRHVEQISPAEIAIVMKIEPGHVRVLVHRAAEQLRKALAGSYAIRPSKDKSHERR